MTTGERTTFISDSFAKYKARKPRDKKKTNSYLRLEEEAWESCGMISSPHSVPDKCFSVSLPSLSLPLSPTPSRNWGPRASVQLHTTQLSMASFSICSLKGRYYTLTYKLGLPVNTPSFLPLPPLSSVKRPAYICLTHICASLSPRTHMAAHDRRSVHTCRPGLLNQLFIPGH